MKIRKCLSFDDILLVPQMSSVTSRKEISLTSSLSNCPDFCLPIISSPMDTVTETEMALSMSSHGGLGIIHRYNTIENQVLMAKDVQSRGGLVAAAIGVSGDYIDRATSLYDAGVRVLCIDIAHGHHNLMCEALGELRGIFGDQVHIMAGNVATREGYEDLVSWGADSVRVGIGGGSICSTRIQTGHGIPTFQSILDCSESDYAGTYPIIADGGIKNSGDIVKAIAAGADFVMLGSLLSGTEESPGSKISRGGNLYKEYRGMASSRAQMNWRGKVASQEGVAAMVPYKGHVSEILSSLEAGIRSGLSYSGCFDIQTFQVTAEMINQTSAGIVESNTHVYSRGEKI
tara:strand:- start:304 stop:1338 length:1035 start_codon:yes stop_codon:yes gene_type:complete